MQGGVRSGAGNTTTLTDEDARAILREVPGVRYVAPSVNTRAQVVAGNQNWSTSIQGTDVDFTAIRSWPTTSGSFFDSADVSRAARVAVIGTVVRDRLFGAGADPIGETIRIREQPFKIIGVLAGKR